MNTLRKTLQDRVRGARYRERHQERLRVSNREKARKRYARNPAASVEAARKWQRLNPEQVREVARTRQSLRRKQDPNFRILTNLRKRLGKAVRGTNKSAPTRELLGCTIPELRAHLEKQFRPEMTWENYGPVWHVDHVRPCAAFNFLDPVQQHECFHYTNLQPLFAAENLSKGARV